MDGIPRNLDQINGWLSVPLCPSCGSRGERLGELWAEDFQFGGIRIAKPASPINLHRCENCTLVFKDLVASPSLLSSLTKQAHRTLWTRPYDYLDELRFIGNSITAQPGELDVLDIGAAGGGFLKSLVGPGRRSALDIMPFTDLGVAEFIEGFLDNPQLNWSGNPYDLVTAFDVLEHLYDPVAAFANMRSFVGSTGAVILETGNTDYVGGGRAIRRWSYLNLLEHHIGWNRRSLEDVAKRTGFQVASFERKIHKGLSRRSLKHEIKYTAFSLASPVYRFPYKLLGKHCPTPSKFAPLDHFRAVLKPV